MIEAIFTATLAHIESWALFFTKHPMLGLLLAFAFAFLESLAVVGTFLPGIILMSFIGYLIGTQAIPLFPAILSVLIGAFFGDYLSYLIGKYYRNAICASRYYLKHITTIQKGENILRKNAILGMTIGRIIGPVRSTIPLIAGLIDMRLSHFLLGASGSVLVWSFCYLGPSLLLTSFANDLSMEMVSFMLHNLISYALHFIIIAALVSFTIRMRTKSQSLPISAYMKEATLSILTLLYIIYLLQIDSDILAINDITLNFLQNHQNYPMMALATAVSISADKYTLYGFCLLASAYMMLRREYWSCLLFSIATFGVGFIIKFVKIIIDYPRPELMLNLLGPTAFPSGHTGLYFTTALALAAMLTHHFPKKKSTLFRITLITTLIVMASRLYLGAHWLSDVIGGMTIGYLLYITTYGFAFSQKVNMDHRPSSAVLLSSIFAAFCILVPIIRLTVPTLTHHYDPKFYLIENRKNIILESAWQEHTPHLIQYATNTYGIRTYPINIQIEASLDGLQKKLTSDSWEAVEKIPGLKPTLLGQKPQLILKKENGSQLYIALWAQNNLIKNDLPLTVGFIIKPGSEKSATSFNHTDQVVKAIQLDDLNHETLSKIPLNIQLQNWDKKVFKAREEESK